MTFFAKTKVECNLCKQLKKLKVVKKKKKKKINLTHYNNFLANFLEGLPFLTLEIN